MNYTKFSAEELVRRYKKELKTVQILRWVTLGCFLAFLVLTANVMNVTLAIAAVVVFVMAMRLLQSMTNQQFVLLQQVLNQDCDALKYTEIMETLEKEVSKKEIMTMRMCRARGLYYSGKFAEAREALDGFYSEKPSLGTALLFRSLSFSCHLAQGNLEGAWKERQETEQILNRTPPKQRSSIQRELLIMDAALALEEERYEEFFPLQKQVLQEAPLPLHRVMAQPP